MRRLNKRGQSTGEYAIVIGLIVAAAIAMQTYVKRGMQGKIRKAVDNISEATRGTTLQYEPYYSHSDFETNTQEYTMTEATTEGGGYEKHMGEAGGSTKTSHRTGTRGIRAASEAD
ncbi:MAG: hypothetical protein JSV30_06160 [Candidatus Omnitrophota bacterium]|nr:MAG: hypothetical protein JSV30_06160 [Candidatus Omnitrophota bacterium]